MAQVIEDIKAGKGWITGVLAFTGVVAGSCTAIFGWEVSKVTAVALVAVCVVLGLSLVIQRSEDRNAKRLQQHIDNAEGQAKTVNDTLKQLTKVVKDTRKDTLRIQLSMYIKDQPDNIDTILKIAEVYFVELGGDWYMTSEFNKWAKSHDIEIPNIIATAILQHKEEL